MNYQHNNLVIIPRNCCDDKISNFFLFWEQGLAIWGNYVQRKRFWVYWLTGKIQLGNFDSKKKQVKIEQSDISNCLRIKQYTKIKIWRLLIYGENTLNEIYDHIRTIFDTYALTMLWTD